MHDDTSDRRHDEPAWIDRVHDLVEGRLDAEGAALLAAAAAEDDELAELLEAYRDVHSATSVAAVEPPACRVTFADVERRVARSERRGALRRLPFRVAAAAALVAGIALAWTAVGPSVDAPDAELVVRLGAIPAAQGVPPESGLETMAATLADFRPVVDGAPGWLADLDGAREIARATRRPVLLFVHHSTCPACVQLRAESFPDAEVLALLAEFVPVHVDITTAPKEIGKYTRQGWPFLGAFGADGEQITAFPGFLNAEQLRERLREAAADADLEDAVPWSHARALAARLDAGVAADDAGDAGRAYREYAALAADDAGGAFGAAAARGLAAIGQTARAALDRAARLPVAEATTLLADESERLAGTPFAADLSAVREALRTSGRFPRLDPPPSRGR